jgi:hypothetical protein
MAKGKDALLAQKEARQKKLLFALIPVFLLLVAWQGPKTFSALAGGSAASPPEPVETTTTAQPPIDPSSAPAPSTSASGAPAAAAPSSALPDTDPLPARDADQLQSFSLFSSQDPFIPRTGPSIPSGGASDSSSTGSTSDAGSQTGSSSGPTSPSGPTTNTATVQVNGSQARVALAQPFPKANPYFQITEIGSNYVKVGLVSGSYLNGSRTQKIRVGHSLTLVKQPEGTPYRITVVSVSFTTG